MIVEKDLGAVFDPHCLEAFAVRGHSFFICVDPWFNSRFEAEPGGAPRRQERGTVTRTPSSAVTQDFNLPRRRRSPPSPIQSLLKPSLDPFLIGRVD
jgi:hypothetical protein